MNAPILLVAGGGLAREVLSACARAGQEVIGILDDDPGRAGTTIAGVPVLGPLERVADHPGAPLVLCAGKGTVRRSMAGRLAALGVAAQRYARIVDPSVWIPPSCRVGPGTILLANTVLTADVTVGAHVVCMPHVTLTHDDVVADYATLAAGVSLGGGVRIGEAAYLGMNSTVRETCAIGSEAVLGMGAALVRDQPAGSVWAGTPARQLEKENS
jgi:sugar O-acyltransferase (sialic acid O-acetyltransferase NeuD family)